MIKKRDAPSAPPWPLPRWCSGFVHPPSALLASDKWCRVGILAESFKVEKGVGRTHLLVTTGIFCIPFVPRRFVEALPVHARW